APAYLRADLEVLDDNRRLVTGLTFPTVPYAVQVQRLLKEAVEDSRRFRQHQFYLVPDAQILEPGDVVAWTSARNGYTNKKFLVGEAADQPNLLVLVTLKEIDPSDFSWDPLTDEHEYSVGFVGPIHPPTQLMTGWGAAPYIIQQGSKQLPSILVTFDGDLDDVQSVRVQARFAGASTVQFDGTLPYGDPATNDDPASVVLNGNFLPDTDYEVRGIYQPYSGRKTDWAEWIAVKTPDVWISDIYPIDLDRLGDDVKDLMAWASNGRRDVLEELRAVSAWAANQELSNFADKQELRTELRSETDTAFGKVTAAYTDAILVATGPNSALAQRITTLEVTIPSLAAASAVDALAVRVTEAEGDITSNAAAIASLTASVADKADASAVTALSATVSSQGGLISTNTSAITALETSYGAVSGSATMRMQTGYTPASGWTSRIGMQTRINDGATFRDAGLFLESTSSQARIIMAADQLAILAGGSLAALFDSGTAYIANARIRNLTGDNVTANSLYLSGVGQVGSVLTDLIAAEAASSTGSAFSGSTLTVGPASTGTAQAAGISGVQSGGSVMILFTAMTTADGNDGWQYNLYRGSTLLRSYSLTGTASQKDSTLIAYRDAPGAGSFTYVVELTKLGTQNVYSSNRSLMLWNQKR
ncbi:MAG: hypothetical protein ACTHOP_02390, partial [Mesorhizobium sp.]